MTDTTPNTPASDSRSSPSAPRASRWVVMWNLPGCLPEMEPEHYSSWEDARRSLLSTLEDLGAWAEPEDEEQALEARECAQEVAALKPEEEWGGSVGYYCYELTEGDPIDPRIQALAKHLGEDPDDITAGYDKVTFDHGSREYLVMTDSEADSRAADYIRDTVWAFNASWIADYTPEGIDSDTIEAIRGERCEDANHPLTALINAGRGMPVFVRDSIGADGRGHFLSHYDGHENEEEIDGETYYIYRVN